MSGDVSVALVYEPHTHREGPVLIARLDDPALVVRAARSAIGAAQRRATELGRMDELIGELEAAEVGRLRALLAMLVPGLRGSANRF